MNRRLLITAAAALPVTLGATGCTGTGAGLALADQTKAAAQPAPTGTSLQDGQKTTEAAEKFRGSVAYASGMTVVYVYQAVGHHGTGEGDSIFWGFDGAPTPQLIAVNDHGFDSAAEANAFATTNIATLPNASSSLIVVQ